ncbi:hypothetical protein [Spiroplasma endosymbiont of Amphibalanus improvisus]|uniref:hypothetical protein n=1 Tax=Spiroplasma endosymbiont of Amphibalanus improvisus TaxID=3066327 RepID=UPI00313DD558
MNVLNKQQTQNIIGGTLSGAVFSGIADIIQRSMFGVNSLISSINSSILVSQHSDTPKGSYKTSDGAMFEWDDSVLLSDSSSLIN